MIIAGFSGIGKSTFCREVAEAVDFDCMPFKYSNLDSLLVSGRSIEELKASPELDFVCNWESAYLEAILACRRQNPQACIVIPSAARVLRGLERSGVPFLLCYPRPEAREEYRRRFEQRGNTARFIEIFIGGWEHWMKSLRQDPCTIRLEMKPSEYLLDLKPQIDCLAGRL